jgi:hypothetical protein
MDENNERCLELATHPGRKRGNTNPAPWDTLIAEQHRMFKKHPCTTFITAHFDWYPNNLAKLGQHRMDNNFLLNIKTVLYFVKTVGCRRNMPLIFGCWKPEMNICLTIKSTMLFGLYTV